MWFLIGVCLGVVGGRWYQNLVHDDEFDDDYDYIWTEGWFARQEGIDLNMLAAIKETEAHERIAQ